jgi:hypothetical protein
MKQILSLVLALSFLTACNTTQEDIAFKSVGVINLTAVDAMKGWLDYKNTHQVPPEQVEAVKKAWDVFYAAEQEARLAARDYKNGTDTNGLSRAVTLASHASSAVIEVVLKMLPPAEAAKLKGLPK